MEAKIQVSVGLIMSLCVVFIAARIPYWQELIEKLALSEILSPPPSNKCVTDAKVDEVRLVVEVARPCWMAPNFLTKTKIFIISKMFWVFRQKFLFLSLFSFFYVFVLFLIFLKTEFVMLATEDQDKVKLILDFVRLVYYFPIILSKLYQNSN